MEKREVFGRTRQRGSAVRFGFGKGVLGKGWSLGGSGDFWGRTMESIVPTALGERGASWQKGG
ncbi:MAG: hypothetical protein AAF591_20590 [Verrucomicrobiota bacterium]